LLFPGSSRAWELGPWRSWQTLAAELDHGLTIFAALFGRRPASLIAPDYVWDGRCERLWDSRGLHIIQAKREQRYPQWREGRLDQRLRKTVARIWSKLVYPSRIYLERNCRLEPVQTSDWVAATDRCWREIQRAWQRGQPAIVETHRINFVHLERAVVDTGFAALARLMDHLDEAAPPERPLFLVDWEVAQLQRTGTSWCPRGGLLIVRNLTDQTRVIMIPELWAERVVGPASWTGPVAGKAGRGLELGPETSIRLALASQPVAAGRPRQP
jgi:hypothetical protein